jgi:hypothetical protein
MRLLGLLYVSVNTTWRLAMTIVWLLIVVLEVAGVWMVFTKAAQPGWAAIIPFYNYWVMLKIVGRPGWWLILLLIPFVNIVFAIIVLNGLSKSFGKSGGFTVGLVLLSFVFFPILGFGKSQYRGPQGRATLGY